MQLDAVAEGTGDESVGPSDDDSPEEGSVERPVSRDPKSDDDLGVAARRADALPDRTQFGRA